MWLYYWLASAGINPFDDVRTVVVPPPQMVMNMRIGNMVGFCVGEPWNQRAISDGIGFTAATSQQSIWPDHPEKMLGTRADWVAKNPNTARALTAAVLEAARWIDASDDNRRETAQVLAGRAWLNTKPEETILQGACSASTKTAWARTLAGRARDALLPRRQRQLPVALRRHVVPHPA